MGCFITCIGHSTKKKASESQTPSFLESICHLELLFQDNYAVQEVLAEHVFSTSESYELKLVFTYTFCNQSIVNNLSTLFRQFLVPRSATGSLIAITGNFVLPIPD